MRLGLPGADSVNWACSLDVVLTRAMRPHGVVSRPDGVPSRSRDAGAGAGAGLGKPPRGTRVGPLGGEVQAG